MRESRITGSPGTSAKKLTVRLYGRGVFAKTGVRAGGSDATRYFRRKSGQLILSKLDFLNGAIGLVPPELDGYESTLDMPCFDIDPSINPDWLLAHMARPAFYLRYRGSSIGSRKAVRIDVDELLASRISVPSRAEQDRVGAALQVVREAVRSHENVLERRLIAKQAVMLDLLTHGLPRGRRRMAPLSSSWSMGRVTQNITHMPEHWELVELRTLIRDGRVESGHTPSREHPEYWHGGIPWLSLQDTDALEHNLVVTQTAEAVSQLGIDNSSARVLPVDTVVFSRTASVGLCARLGVPMATSQDFANFVCGPRLEPRYLVQVFRHMQREWRRLEEGSTHKTVYMPVFRKLKVLLPPIEEQRVIADAGEAFDIRIAMERQRLERLRSLEGNVTQALLSGQLRLPLLTSMNPVSMVR
ncbi:restriction endonuclease subunit S [Archangium lansingense]|uniref:restriction endonuclease subunit S n=1 Tax=Archangium lansingense TaxID=2995310 RepID=UPI003B78441A